MLEFTQCMRSHGVTNFPEPIAPASVPPRGVTTYLGNGPNPNSSPVYRAASAACQKKFAVAQKVSPGLATQFQTDQLKYARCMRSHGVINFPDPGANGGFPIPKSIDEESPTYRRADKACGGLLPGPPGIG
jgi:hypothetical protein